MATPPNGGASLLVVGMIAALAFVVGALAGFGGLLGFLKADSGNADTFGISTAAEAAECEPCKEATATASGAPGVYGLVYPVEQSLIIEGDLDREVLRQHVVKNRLTLQKCYQERLASNPSLKGEMQIQFTISANGSIAAKVARVDTTEDQGLKTCVLDIIGSWNFKEKVTRMTVVKVDVIFAPLGGTP